MQPDTSTPTNSTPKATQLFTSFKLTQYNFEFLEEKEEASTMTKQKVVISLPMEDSKKKSKALTVIVKFPGVISAEVDNGKVSVVGEGIDSVALTRSLRKKMCHVQIVSVAVVEEKKEEKKEDKPPAPVIVQASNWSYPYSVPQFYYHEAHGNDSCSVM